MTLRFKPLHPLFAAEAAGIDLRGTLAAGKVRRIVAAMDRYAVLAFRGQKLGAEEQLKFARRFGPLTVGFRKIRKGAPHRLDYDALPAGLKTEIAGLRAEHYVLHSRFLLGDTGYTREQRKALPPVEWPLVRTHPGSRRKLLWVGAHATHIRGMTVPEGRMLLMYLLEHATRCRFVYRHRWKAGDLLMWDNRTLMHRGRRFDFSQRREMRRATVEDVDESLENAA